jgi:hypothetical protein
MKFALCCAPQCMRAWRLLTLVSAMALSGCGIFKTIEPGMMRDEVIAAWGKPTRVVPLLKGTRLQYSLQPMGRYATMVDLDASGRVLQSSQVLNAQEFARIELDKWTRADVEMAFGPPAEVSRVASWPHDILTYRWYDGIDLFFWIYLDQNQVVRRTGQGIEFYKVYND